MKEKDETLNYLFALEARLGIAKKWAAQASSPVPEVPYAAEKRKERQVKQTAAALLFTREHVRVALELLDKLLVGVDEEAAAE